MSPTRILGFVLMLGPLACATDGQSNGGCVGGCAGEVQYPHSNPEAAPTDKSMRFRITEAGFDSIAAALPDLLASSCQESDGDLNAACELDPANPDYARFYVGEPCAPIEGVLALPLIPDITTEIRSGPCNNVDYHRSAIGIHLDSFEGNIHLNLVQDSTGDGIQVVIGCNEASGCTSENDVNISLDMVWNLSGLWTNNSCEISDDNANEAGIIIHSFKVVLRPRIERDAQGQPHLILEPDAVDADNVDLDFNFGLSGADYDPACPNSCDVWCGFTNGLSAAIEVFLEQELIATLLADVIADAVGGGLNDTSLEATGHMEVPLMMGGNGRNSNPMFFLIAPDDESPDVTGAAGEKGLNFDIDTGYWGEHSNCVPNISAPSWLLPAPIDPGSMVQAPDPITGNLEWEVFDMAFLLGDSAISRLAYSLFDSGNLCLPLGPDAMDAATNGAFAPNLQLVSFVAPGIGRLGPPETPVLLALAPNFPPHLKFGDGSGEGETRNSHIQLTWPNLELEIYPLMDDVYQRVLSFSVDVDVGVSLEAAPSGNLKVMIDRIQLGNAFSTYNEIGTPFDAQAIEDLVETFLPLILEAGPFTEIDLSSGALGIPFVPKMRSIQLADDDGRYLAFYVKICSEQTLNDPTNTLCYEDPTEEEAQPQPRIRNAGPEAPHPGNLTLVVSDLTLADGAIEMAYRVNGTAWRNFRPADENTDNEFTIDNGALRWPGIHRIEIMTRQESKPTDWSEPVAVTYITANRAPGIQSWRVGNEIHVQGWDDTTLVSALEYQFTRIAPTGFVEASGWTTLTSFAANPEDLVQIQARDAVGQVSRIAIMNPADAPEPEYSASPVQGEVSAPPAAAGCASVPNPAPFLLILGLIGRNRRRKSLK